MEEIGQSTTKSWPGKTRHVFFYIIGLLVLSFLFAFCFYFYSLVRDAQKNQNQTNLTNKKLTATESALILGTGKNYWLGAANPKITIVEFGDFACPLCHNSFYKIREIGLKYKNDVKIIFRDYPIITEYSADLALAARCAGEQGLFWPFYDKLFINQGVSSKDELTELARQTGADMVKFSFCLEQKKYFTDIQKDYSDGQSLKLTGTPTWFINGNKIEGDIPYATFIQIIDSLIK